MSERLTKVTLIATVGSRDFALGTHVLPGEQGVATMKELLEKSAASLATNLAREIEERPSTVAYPLEGSAK